MNTRLKSAHTGQEVLVGSRDFRFRSDSGELEPQSGPTQFGRNRDHWGRWFGTQNSNPDMALRKAAKHRVITVYLLTIIHFYKNGGGAELRRFEKEP